MSNKTPFQSTLRGGLQSTLRGGLLFLGLWLLLSAVVISLILFGIFNPPALLFGLSLAIGFQLLTGIGLTGLFVLFTAGIVTLVNKGVTSVATLLFKRRIVSRFKYLISQRKKVEALHLFAEKTLLFSDSHRIALSTLLFSSGQFVFENPYHSSYSDLRQSDRDFEKLLREDVEALFELLKTDKALTSLDLSRAFFTKNANSLAEMLKTNTTLTSLKLSDNELTDSVINVLFEALQENIALTKLNLRNNAISDTEDLALTQALTNNANLKELDLSFNSIGRNKIRALSEVLKKNTALAKLNLSGNRLRSPEIQVLSVSLKGNTTLTELNLEHNGLHDSDAGVQALSDVLKSNTSLEELSLRSCYVNTKGLQTLFDALKKNTTLTKLNLSFNEVNDDGVEALSCALKINKSLKELRLRHSYITTTGVQALSKALKKNTALTALYLDYDDIGDSGARTLLEALKQNTTLISLNLNLNPIEDADFCFDASTQINQITEKNVSFQLHLQNLKKAPLQKKETHLKQMYRKFPEKKYEKVLNSLQIKYNSLRIKTLLSENNLKEAICYFLKKKGQLFSADARSTLLTNLICSDSNEETTPFSDKEDPLFRYKLVFPLYRLVNFKELLFEEKRLIQNMMKALTQKKAGPIGIDPSETICDFLPIQSMKHILTKTRLESVKAKLNPEEDKAKISSLERIIKAFDELTVTELNKQCSQEIRNILGVEKQTLLLSWQQVENWVLKERASEGEEHEKIVKGKLKEIETLEKLEEKYTFLDAEISTPTQKSQTQFVNILKKLEENNPTCSTGSTLFSKKKEQEETQQPPQTTNSSNTL